MNRSWQIWTILGACALLIVGAMAWSTLRVLELEEKQASAEATAELEERVRLGLSRIDSVASALMVLENQRPAHHFKAFFEPDDIFTNEFQEVSKGIVVQPSPLLAELPEFVRLHFEIDAQSRQVSSPQVPVGNELDLAEGSGIPGAYLERTRGELGSLRALLAQPSTAGVPAGTTNLEQICLTCTPAQAAVTWNAPQVDAVQQTEALVAELREQNRGNSLELQPYQREVTLLEKSKRAEAYNQASQRALPKQMVRNTLPAAEVQSKAASENDALQQQADVAPRPLIELAVQVTPFQPVWVGEELIAVREVRRGGAIAYQGVWLKAPELSRYLLSVAADLLPRASLERMQEVSAASLPLEVVPSLEALSNDPLSLVTLPWRIRPGEEPGVALLGWSALRISLVVGWVALLLALLGAAVLVRGVMRLSDRRATFVSSVTHELRTPLTTFHLYSDMLAEGMVRDEDQQQNYLRTMRREAERLNHLVENVLSYSRVERGSARAEHQRISVAGLIERMRPRLEERARKDGAELEVECDGGASDAEVETDLTAVEQIIFNLVDNACKYGLAEEGRRVVHLRAVGCGRARLEVCDEGGGIAQADVKKLFRPFHKSARDAAHSKPGVGLGLALCRRLASELGGSLRLEQGKRKGMGACFVLELPHG